MADTFLDRPTPFKVAQIGNPVLRKAAEPLTPEEIVDPRTAHFIDSMILTMHAHSGVGLAAPQVHVSKKIVVIGAQENPRYPKESIPLTVLINPEITKFSNNLEEGWEGCLSVKDIWGRVKRSTAVTVKAFNREGKETLIEAEGFFAVVLQHEIDHLYGKLFVDRMEDMATLSFSSEMHNSEE